MKTDQIMTDSPWKESVSYLSKWKRRIKFKNLQWHIKPLKKPPTCTGHSSESEISGCLCWWDASILGHHKMLIMKHEPPSLSWEGFCQLKCKSTTRRRIQQFQKDNSRKIICFEVKYIFRYVLAKKEKVKIILIIYLFLNRQCLSQFKQRTQWPENKCMQC